MIAGSRGEADNEKEGRPKTVERSNGTEDRGQREACTPHTSSHR